MAGIAAALSLLVKLDPRALAYRQISRLFRCLVLAQDLTTTEAVTHHKSRSRIIAQMGICQAAADTFLAFEPGFVGQLSSPPSTVGPSPTYITRAHHSYGGAHDTGAHMNLHSAHGMTLLLELISSIYLAGASRADVVPIMQCLTAVTLHGWGLAAHYIGPLFDRCLRVHLPRFAQALDPDLDSDAAFQIIPYPRQISEWVSDQVSCIYKSQYWVRPS